MTWIGLIMLSLVTSLASRSRWAPLGCPIVAVTFGLSTVLAAPQNDDQRYVGLIVGVRPRSPP